MPLKLKTECAGRVPGQRQGLSGRQRDTRHSEVRLHGKLASTPIDQNNQFDLGWTTIVKQFIDHRTDRSPGVENIIEQDDFGPFDVKWQHRLAT